MPARRKHDPRKPSSGLVNKACPNKGNTPAMDERQKRLQAEALAAESAGVDAKI